MKGKGLAPREASAAVSRRLAARCAGARYPRSPAAVVPHTAAQSVQGVGSGSAAALGNATNRLRAAGGKDRRARVNGTGQWRHRPPGHKTAVDPQLSQRRSRRLNPEMDCGPLPRL